jgi:hypothetical protein
MPTGATEFHDTDVNDYHCRHTDEPRHTVTRATSQLCRARAAEETIPQTRRVRACLLRSAAAAPLAARSA